jgi:hypothetical protein
MRRRRESSIWHMANSGLNFLHGGKTEENHAADKGAIC